MSKTSKLQTLLQTTDLDFIIEAHNGVSARIAEESGFEGIWASGLALSAQYGVRDNNEASWTQIVDMVEFMADVTSIPILLDGDTGYGNFNNMRRLVRKLEQRGIAGVCIEDKLFPKKNSFISGEKQELADIDEFCGKIAAGKDSQLDPDFCIVARVEAYIAGWDTKEAIRRADAYQKAGADAILIHSALSQADQILEFSKEWASRAPLIIVPTKYYSTPTQVFRDANINLVIWANHLIRSAITAMQNCAAKIKEQETLTEVEDDIASVKEIFRLQGAEELAEAERQYFLGSKKETKAIILAASRGESLDELTVDRPKAMIPVNGKPLLSRLVDRCKRQGVDSVTIVGGYRADKIPTEKVNLVINEKYETSGELSSLLAARDHFSNDMVVLYGDLLFRGYVLRSLIESNRELTIVVDSQNVTSEASGVPDLAHCSSPDNRTLWGQDILLKGLSVKEEVDIEPADGRWIGMLRVKGVGCEWMTTALQKLQEKHNFCELSLRDLLNQIINDGNPIRVIYIHGHWIDVNSITDLNKASAFAASHLK